MLAVGWGTEGGPECRPGGGSGGEGGRPGSALGMGSAWCTGNCTGIIVFSLFLFFGLLSSFPLFWRGGFRVAGDKVACARLFLEQMKMR